MNTVVKMTALVLALGATTASVGFISPAQAQSLDQARIDTSVDLASAQGQRTLERRIGRAADMLCSDASERLEIRVRKASNACRDDVVRSARATISRLSGESANSASSI